MKKNLQVTAITAVFLLGSNVYASDLFRCSVSKAVMIKSLCTVCINRVAENCYEEAEVTCLIESRVDTGLEDYDLHPSGEFFLGAKNDDTSFIFSQSKSGYTARVSSLSANAEASISSSVPLDAWGTAITLSAKTSQSREVEGNVMSIILDCRSE